METTRSTPSETLAQVHTRLAREADAVYRLSPFSALSRDYFSRFSRDLERRPELGELEIRDDWSIIIGADAHPTSRLMAGHLAEFLQQCVGVELPVITVPAANPEGVPHSITLVESGGGDPAIPESFTLLLQTDRAIIHGCDPGGVRDGIVRIVNLMGLRQAPYLECREQVYRPRLAVRIGALPWLGACRDLVFLGYNTVLLPGATLFELSTSDVIPELAARRHPDALAKMRRIAEEAVQYGLKTYCWVSTVTKFAKGDPIFNNHPGIRGALTWKEDGDYILCTEHPLVQQWLTDSVERLFRDIPGLWGLGIIIGGEGFYHCFMRPYGATPGHTTCPRCEALGPERVVSRLCNAMAQAARRVNPDAHLVAWPYSAEHVWAVDGALAGVIENLAAGTAILTEIEKEALVEKPYGLSKLIWDYSIDAIGPCSRARDQISLCQGAGIPALLKSEPELAFEASRLANVPCMDRWLARAEALAASGAMGAAVVPAFRNFFATVAAEAGLWMWWEPCRNAEWVLAALADRVAGPDTGPALRQAWHWVSEAIAYSPEIPAYYHGPHYLGPAHPMCADRDALLPQVFYGQYLFRAEMTEAEGLELRPTFWRDVANAEPLIRCYRQMHALLQRALGELGQAAQSVPARCRIPFEAEVGQIRWFYHTVRTEVNFYESCTLRDRITALLVKRERTPEETQMGLALCERWRETLLDEWQNAREALPLAQADVRLDFYYGGDHTFPHLEDMLQAKIKLVRAEIDQFLPSVAGRFGSRQRLTT